MGQFENGAIRFIRSAVNEVLESGYAVSDLDETIKVMPMVRYNTRHEFFLKNSKKVPVMVLFKDEIFGKYCIADAFISKVVKYENMWRLDSEWNYGHNPFILERESLMKMSNWYKYIILV